MNEALLFVHRTKNRMCNFGIFSVTQEMHTLTVEHSDKEVLLFLCEPPQRAIDILGE